MKTMIRACVILCVGALLAASVASAETFKDKTAAAAAGDRSASAPSIDLPSSFSYRGGTIQSKQAMARGLICNQDAKGVTCFDHAADAAAAAGSPRYDLGAAVAAKASSVKGHSKFVAQASSQYCSSYPQLHLFQYAQDIACIYSGNGWDLPLTGEGAWYNMGSYANGASAYFMGNHSGHMSDYNDGGGYWVPYATGVGDYYLNLNGTGWSNRIDSRYRN
ncbi:MAG TPA: hypothetical protein VHZ75_10165 [Solirubrobacteraceae bacterium]|jgi:hypothetical protein|nr:hypothetical protein [Solirubrobacteraceae bacterium]